MKGSLSRVMCPAVTLLSPLASGTGAVGKEEPGPGKYAGPSGMTLSHPALGLFCGAAIPSAC